MIALTIPNLRLFTSHLFLKETFDQFLLVEADIITYNSFHIDGTINKSFYTEEEREQLNSEDFSRWGTIRPICFSLIRGNKLPLSFKIIFRLSKSGTQKLLAQESLFEKYDIEALYFNVLYKNNSLTCTTGVSTKQFQMDKTVEHIWDEKIRQFFKKWNIDFDQY